MTESVPFRPFRLDLALEDARPPSVRVPEGYYLLECEGCDTPVQTKTSTGVRVRYHIVQGPDANPNLGLGGKINDFNTLEVPGKERNNFPLTVTLVALGRSDIVLAFAAMGEKNVIDSVATLQSVFRQVSDAIKGRRLVADIRDRQGQSQPFSDITNVFPVEEWETLRKSVVYSGNPNPGPGFAMPAQPRSSNGPAPAGVDLFADLDKAI